MPALLFRPSRVVLTFGAFAAVAGLAFAAHGATAQSATGTVTGRVLWGSCIGGIPLPMAPGAQVEPGAAVGSDAPAQQIAPDSRPDSRPFPVNGLPAGAVLVAVQNTAVSARTDEAGRFTLSDVPAGQYMTVAAGPVADSVSAIAERPNVFVSGGQSVDVGTLSLGGTGFPPFSIACRLPRSLDNTGPGDATNATPPSDTPNP